MHLSMPLRIATVADLPALLALERSPVARQFVGQWTEGRHQATLASADCRYYVSETASGIDAYAILRGLSENSRSIELKRIVVATPGQVLGRKGRAGGI